MNYYETLYIIHPAIESGRLKDTIVSVQKQIEKNQENKTHSFATFAKFFPSNLQIKDASAKEKYIDEPTNPKYNRGGCIASAGSCNIGLRPKPS